MCLGFQFRRWIRSELYVRSRYASANEEVNVLRNYTLNVSRVGCSSVQKKWEQTYFGEQIAKFCFRVEKGTKFRCIYCSNLGETLQTRWWINTNFRGIRRNKWIMVYGPYTFFFLWLKIFVKFYLIIFRFFNQRLFKYGCRSLYPFLRIY